jgi:hypothetical protein
MQFCEPSNSGTCTAPTTQFRVVVVSPQQAQIIDFQGGSAANGEIVSQPDAFVFNTGGLIGGYAFSFSGVSSSMSEESVVGEFVADGDPGHSGIGKITSGELDINAGGVIASNVPITSGTYTVFSNGRGTATLLTSGPTIKLAFYMVSASRAKFLETDSSPILVGDSFKQQLIAPWGPSDLNGSMVFGTAGSGPSSGIADLVSFRATATSGSNHGTLTAASIDENSGGTVPPPAAGLSGSYTFDLSGNGRGTLSLPGHSYVFYMIAPEPDATAVVQEVTAGIVAHGSLIQPKGGPFTGAALKGSYAFDLSGHVAAGEEDMVGQLAADGDPNNTGTGKITSSLLDVNNFGALQAAQVNTGTYNASVAANGRTTMSLTPTAGGTARTFVLYFVTPAAIFGLGTDSTGPTITQITKQF